MKYLIALEPKGAGFSVQVPDMEVYTSGDDIESAKKAAAEAIRLNLYAYEKNVQEVPTPAPPEKYMKDPEFENMLFTYIEVSE